MSDSENPMSNEAILIVPCLVMVDSLDLLVGINAQKILGVVECERISSLPASHYPFIGLYDHHQEAVPIMNLAAVLKQPSIDLVKTGEHLLETMAQPLESQALAAQVQNTHLSPNKIIICQLCNITIGILVDATYRIESIKSSQILNVPKVLENCSSCMLNGLYRYRNRFLYLLDLERILDSFGLINTPEEDEIHVSLKHDNLAGKSVLIVDDSKIFRHQLSKLMSAHGISYHEAVDGQDGFDKFMNNPNQYDAIFTDFEMPRMNGLEMARKIRQNGATVPFVFNSSISNPALISEIKAEHGCFLVKFQPELILNELYRILGSD